MPRPGPRRGRGDRRGAQRVPAADEASEARSRTWSYADEAAATAAFATATGPEVIACIADGAEARLQGEDYEPGGAVTGGGPPAPVVGRRG